MYVEALEEKYPHLKTEFPKIFIFLFSADGELNDFGKMADELYALRKAVYPFTEILKASSGRIPVEKISAKNWHDLSRAMGR